MRLGLLTAFLIYYGIIAAIFNFGGVYLVGATSEIPSTPSDYTYVINDSSPNNSSQFIEGTSNRDKGIWDIIKRGVSTLGFMFFGIGLPSDTPSWFNWGFVLLQTLITVLMFFFVYDSVWGGGG